MPTMETEDGCDGGAAFLCCYGGRHHRQFSLRCAHFGQPKHRASPAASCASCPAASLTCLRTGVSQRKEPSYTFARALLKIDGSTASTGRSHLIQEPGKLGYAARTACPRVLPAFA